jgi:hypothetical protein
MEARKTVKQSSWSSVAKLMGGFSRKGLNYFGQSKSNEIGLATILSRMAKIGKNHFLPHSITLAYEEIKCIFEKDRRSLCHKGNHYSFCLLLLNVIKCHLIH